MNKSPAIELSDRQDPLSSPLSGPEFKGHTDHATTLLSSGSCPQVWGTFRYCLYEVWLENL